MKELSWYLPDRESMLGQKGPFTTMEIVAQIRARKITVDEFIFGSHFVEAKWRRIIEVEEFFEHLSDYPRAPTPKRLSRGRLFDQLKGELPKAEENIVQSVDVSRENLFRRFPRVPFQAPVILHNQKTYRKGIAADLSEKGLFVALDDADAFERGEEITVTVLDGSDFHGFSAVGVVMRIVHENGIKGFGVFFQRINPQVRRKISKYIKRSLEGRVGGVGYGKVA